MLGYLWLFRLKAKTVLGGHVNINIGGILVETVIREILRVEEQHWIFGAKNIDHKSSSKLFCLFGWFGIGEEFKCLNRDCSEIYDK